MKTLFESLYLKQLKKFKERLKGTFFERFMNVLLHTGSNRFDKHYFQRRLPIHIGMSYFIILDGEVFFMQ